MKQIAELFLMMFMGYLIVRTKVLKIADSSAVSLVMLYLIMPCNILEAFQVERTPERTTGLVVAFIAIFILHIVYLFLLALFRKILHLTIVEQASAMYSNCGNMIIPIITAMFGKEWVIFCCAYMTVQTIFMWTHMKGMFCNEKKINWKEFLINPNVAVIIIGIIMYGAEIKFPPLVESVISTTGAAIAPLSMIVIGMLLAGVNLGKLFTTPRVYAVVFLRLIVFPLCFLPILIFMLRGLALEHMNKILMITFLAAMAPCAATTSQMAQIYHKEGEYASGLNVISVLFCIVTMPLLIGLYNYFLPI